LRSCARVKSRILTNEDAVIVGARRVIGGETGKPGEAVYRLLFGGEKGRDFVVFQMIAHRKKGEGEAKRDVHRGGDQSWL